MRRDAFLVTRGYLPLHHAYGMEEADLALQFLDAGRELLYAPALRVYHDTRLEHHASEAVNAAHIRNTALLAYLRYPIPYWALGALQVLNRVRYAAHRGPLARNCKRCLANSRGCLALSPAAQTGSRCHDRLEQGTCPSGPVRI